MIFFRFYFCLTYNTVIIEGCRAIYDLAILVKAKGNGAFNLTANRAKANHYGYRYKMIAIHGFEISSIKSEITKVEKKIMKFLQQKINVFLV